MPLYHLVAKELLLLRRDWHALALLFLMPAAFILVMSLALRDTFASHGPSALGYILLNQDDSALAGQLAARVRANANFRELPFQGRPEEATALARRGKAHFVLVIPAGFGKAFRSAHPLAVQLQAGPGVEPTVFKLFEAALREAAGKIYLADSLAKYGAAAVDLDHADALVSAKSLYEGGAQALPSSVQQNVPAWLVFAMFFIAIPLSTTWVQERSLGTMARLKTMGVPPATLLLGKLLPYGLVNLLQVAIMLAIGVYLVPQLGGEALSLGHSPAGLLLMALSLSFASVSFALLIANLAGTAEQATIFTGVCNLVLAALGGIMVPRFIMPPAMQSMSLASPLAWGLEGFLDIFLRQGGLKTVLPWAGLLFTFGLACLGLAGILLGRQRAK
jgi:ABC-2 type transport system permease protein